MNRRIIFFILLFVFIFSGCQDKKQNTNIIDEDINPNEIINEDEEIKSEEDTEEEIESINYDEVKPNELGHIMVVMYHGILDLPPYHRIEEDFLKDLQYMYDNNYRLISMEDYKNNNINIKAGFTPIVLTFDDGLSTTFSLEEVEGKLVAKKGTAIELLERFCNENPDFGKAASLYINGGKNAFEGAGTYEERLNWLVDNGYEIGNHTYSHPKLSQLNAEEIQKEIGMVDTLIKKAIKDYTVDVITYPHGIRPEESLRKFVVSGSYEGQSYNYSLGFREGPSGPMVPPLHIDFDPYNCPRVRGSDGAEGDLWWWFNYYENHPKMKFISDGNPNRISVPQEYEDKINLELIEEKELYIY